MDVSASLLTICSHRLNLLLNVLDLCVTCFEYKGKPNLVNQLSGIAAVSNKASTVKDQIASDILGVGTAKKKISREHEQTEKYVLIGFN